MLLALATVVNAADRQQAARFPITREYDRGLSDDDKRGAIQSTVELFHGLGIELRFDAASLQRIETAAGGRLALGVEESVDALYDAIYFLTDLARLPSEIYPLIPRLAVVRGLRSAAVGTGKLKRVPLGRERTTGFLLIDSENINQLNTFGSATHPKVNFAMLLQVAVEARLGAIPPAALAELGLDLVIDDAEWARLNAPGDAGAKLYNGEDVPLIGIGSLLRITPPGMVYDAVREVASGVEPDAYPGLAEPSEPWWSPRHSAQLDRQSIMRCLFSRGERFFDRLGGTGGAREDAILKEKTRLVLYAAFVASGGALDHQFWRRRHPQREIVLELTRDFERGLLDQLNDRLKQRGGGYHLSPAARPR